MSKQFSEASGDSERKATSINSQGRDREACPEDLNQRIHSMMGTWHGIIHISAFLLLFRKMTPSFWTCRQKLPWISARKRMPEQTWDGAKTEQNCEGNWEKDGLSSLPLLIHGVAKVGQLSNWTRHSPSLIPYQGVYPTVAHRLSCAGLLMH